MTIASQFSFGDIKADSKIINKQLYFISNSKSSVITAGIGLFCSFYQSTDLVSINRMSIKW